MEKQNYTVKEIILGTRREYRKLYDYLYVLKALTVCNNKEVQDYYFKLSVDNGKKPELIWQFMQNPRTLRGLVYYLQKSIDSFKDMPEYKIILKHERNERLIINEQYDVSVDGELVEYFERIVDLIISSNFANSINFKFHSLPDMKGSLILSLNGISYNCILNNNYTSLDYYSEFDYIKLHHGNEDILDVSLLREMLNAPIPGEVLSTYHRNLISESSAILKPVKAYIGEYGKFSPMTRIRIKEFDKEILFSTKNQ